jgi:UDP-N-acetylmuramoyl-tripeptide--D-alanyl-D-alanine ligase
MILPAIAALVALIAAGAFLWRRGLTYLHIFQQEEYDGRRFLRWLLATGSVDRIVTAPLAVLGIAELAAGRSWAFQLAAAAALGWGAWRERDPRREAKKKLVLTQRARRILGVALALAALPALAAALSLCLVWVLAVQAVPLCLVAANLLLRPVEEAVQQRYLREAQAKLARLKPTVVAVTGSFGKTSVKHILGHVLEIAAPTLITPGSVNTPMGVSRIIRERLEERHRFFVVEMGAYGPGSIARLCRLAPPDLGVITAVGLAHYERFRSLDTVARTKFELAEAAAARGGKIVVAEAAMTQAPARDFAARHPEALVLCTIGAVRQEREGVVAELEWRGARYALRAPLYGLHHGTNIALAFIAAVLLGLSPELALTALRSTPQIPHRLEVKRQAEGWTLIDDSYNANPVGFAGALGVLDLLRGAGGRRVLVTPGMVELGAAHEEEHRRLGALAAQHVDVLLPVCPERIPSFVSGFKDGAPTGAEIVPCRSLAAAMAWLGPRLAAADAVLLENDLPDLYESRLRL